MSAKVVESGTTVQIRTIVQGERYSRCHEDGGTSLVLRGPLSATETTVIDLQRSTVVKDTKVKGFLLCYP